MNYNSSEIIAKLEELNRKRHEFELTPEEEAEILDALPDLLKELRAGQADKWTCFHCGFTTSDREQANAHFGDDAGETALCQDWGSWTDQERLEQIQNVGLELNREREENLLFRTKIEGLEYRLGGQLSEIHSFKPFRQCDTIHQVFNVYDSMEGRAMLAEEQRDSLKQQLCEAQATIVSLKRAGWVTNRTGPTASTEPTASVVGQAQSEIDLCRKLSEKDAVIAELEKVLSPIVRMLRIEFDTGQLPTLRINDIPTFRPIEASMRDELGTLFTYLFNASVALAELEKE